MFKQIIPASIIATALVFHAIWSGHHQISFTVEEQVLVGLASSRIYLEMSEDHAPAEYVGKYMQGIGVDVWPEYLQREVMRKVESSFP